MTLKGKITISKGDGCIEIRIQDDNSRANFFEGRMKLADFAEAVTGLGYQDIEFKVYGLKVIGLNWESKPVPIPIPIELTNASRKLTDEEIKSAIDATGVEVDGWKIRSYYDFGNHYKYTRVPDTNQRICNTFLERYVDENGNPVEI
jgi:hypothetical protein